MLYIQWSCRLRMPSFLPCKTYCSTFSALDLAAFSTSFLVSPSFFVSEYYTAGALLLLLSVLMTFYFSVLFFCYTILLFCKFSMIFSSFFMFFSVHKLLDSPLYCHSICFPHLLFLSTCIPAQSDTS